MNINEQLEKFKIPIGIGLVGLVLIIGGAFFSSSTKSVASKEFPKESLVKGDSKIVVDVSGAVNQPGVYQLSSSDRIDQAIKAGGGFTDNADRNFIAKNLNLAAKVSDGMKIYIPKTGEVGIVAPAGAVAGTSTSIVNINSGSQSQLESLPGIGPVTAAKIISGRPFGQINDLLDQKIVPKATFEKIKDQISI